MRRCSFRDTGQDLEALGSFNVSPIRFPWNTLTMKKNYTD